MKKYTLLSHSHLAMGSVAPNRYDTKGRNPVVPFVCKYLTLRKMMLAEPAMNQWGLRGKGCRPIHHKANSCDCHRRQSTVPEKGYMQWGKQEQTTVSLKHPFLWLILAHAT